jgi:hypothetical protein
LKPQRRAKYFWLRSRHFSPTEAREFSKLDRQYPALKKMVRQRSGTWLSYQRKMEKAGITSQRGRMLAWRDTLRAFYEQNRVKAAKDGSAVLHNWVVQRDARGKPTKPKPSPWEWYDAVFKGLPDEDKWDTPRSHRRRTREPTIQLGNVLKQKWLSGLRDTVRREPWRRDELKEQARRLGGRI